MSTSTAWSRRGYADTINCELVPGVILKGANIAPKPGQSYQAFFTEWDWAGWIKPQIDSLDSVGGNTVRLIGDVAGVNNSAFTQSYYDDKWSQLIGYADTLGMYVYPAGGGVSQIGALSVSQVADTVAAAAENWDTHANVVGIDILQESVRAQAAGSYPLSFPSEMTSPVRSATTKPITFSNSGPHPFGTARFAFPLWRNILRPYIDFWDIHVYTVCPKELIHLAFWAQGESKPVVIGEFAAHQGLSTGEQTRRYQNALDIVNTRYGGLHVAGILQWALYPQSITASDDWGMFDSGGVPRSHLTDLFEELPTS
ncbi:MAG: hypothetical protein CMK98_13545 [Pseudomonas sp.]|nr:hypothetical protein [Pseudomonas sp.]